MVGYGAASRSAASLVPPALTINAEGRSPFVLVCDHASNRIPQRYGDLGLTPLQRLLHVAWDPGALAVALHLSDALAAPLVQSTVSRLVVDCNRAPDAPDLVVVRSETVDIPGNRPVGPEERAHRIAAFHIPYHQAIEALLSHRHGAGRETLFVAVHSFTPVYHGVHRPWPIGLIPGRDPTLARLLGDALRAEVPGLALGWNQPYAADSGVTYTLDHHANRYGLPAVMIELRHDEILLPGGVALWADRLARCLEAARLARASS